MSVFSPDVNIDSPLPLPIDGGNPNPVLVTGTITMCPDVNVHDGSGNTIASTGTSLNVDVTNFPATQPISGTVTVANPGLTDAQLRATPVPVSGTVTSNIGTTGGLALDATLTNGTQHTLVDNFPVTQPISGTVAISNFPADADALAQGSSTPGQLGALEMGATTTAAPVYVTGTTNPLSLDVAG